MRLSEWIMRENSLRSILNVPQDPTHHPEGNVDKHSYMVLRSLNKAIDSLKNRQQEDPAGPLANLNLNLSEKEIKILKIAALLHDIGKGEAFGYNKKGRISAWGHDTPEKYEPAMRRLGPIWQKMYNDSDPEAIEIIRFLIDKHMKVQSPSLGKMILGNDGKYINDSKVKLLLILWMMDKLGRGGEANYNRNQRLNFISQNDQGSQKSLENIYKLVDIRKKDKPNRPQSTKLDVSPEEFIKILRSKGLDNNRIKQSAENKFGRPFSDEEISEGFKAFLENDENIDHRISANIPLDGEVEQLANAFKAAGKDLYVVGGAVRDYLFHYLDGDSKPYKPKDIDLSTNASPAEVQQILANIGIRSLPKGEAFGVVSAIINKKEYEIASFRSEWYDPESGDGRRPDKVELGVTAKSDASRRDLTMNALFYDIAEKQIIDFNLDKDGKGQGIHDIVNKIARPVGNARDRFREDKLRIPRLIRFFSRFNPSYIQSHLDHETMEAIHEFKELSGVSPERVSAEFLAGLDKCLDVPNYLKNYETFGLLSKVVLRGVQLDFEHLDNLKNIRDAVVVFATLLKQNPGNFARTKLNALKYSNNIADAVEYLIDLYHFQFTLDTAPDNVRNTINLLQNKRKATAQQIRDFAKVVGLDIDRINYLIKYELPKINSKELMDRGVTGNALGDEIRLQQFQDFYRLRK